MKDALPSALRLLHVLVGLSMICRSVQGFRPLSVTGFQGKTSATTSLKLTYGRKLQPAAFNAIQNVNVNRQSSLLFQSGDDSDAGSSETPKRRRKRVKRKEKATAAPPIEEEKEEKAAVTKTVPEFRPREDAAVNLQVQDIRDLVGGGSPSSTASSSSGGNVVAASSSSATTSTSSGKTKLTDSLSPESLEMLLQDAKEMQALEKKQEGEVGAEEEGDLSITDRLKGAVSTLVTIDFFVICAFLVWFLAGIFCSYILKDDTVQIAFNGLFQPVVQPALGFLMVAAIAGAFNSDEEELQ